MDLTHDAGDGSAFPDVPTPGAHVERVDAGDGSAFVDAPTPGAVDLYQGWTGSGAHAARVRRLQLRGPPDDRQTPGPPSVQFTDEEVRVVFNKYDPSGTGLVSIMQMALIMREMGREVGRVEAHWSEVTGNLMLGRDGVPKCTFYDVSCCVAAGHPIGDPRAVATSAGGRRLGRKGWLDFYVAGQPSYSVEDEPTTEEEEEEEEEEGEESSLLSDSPPESDEGAAWKEEEEEEEENEDREEENEESGESVEWDSTMLEISSDDEPRFNEGRMIFEATCDADSLGLLIELPLSISSPATSEARATFECCSDSVPSMLRGDRPWRTRENVRYKQEESVVLRVPDKTRVLCFAIATNGVEGGAGGATVQQIETRVQEWDVSTGKIGRTIAPWKYYGSSTAADGGSPLCSERGITQHTAALVDLTVDGVEGTTATTFRISARHTFRGCELPVGLTMFRAYGFCWPAADIRGISADAWAFDPIDRRGAVPPLPALPEHYNFTKIAADNAHKVCSAASCAAETAARFSSQDAARAVTVRAKIELEAKLAEAAARCEVEEEERRERGALRRAEIAAARDAARSARERELRTAAAAAEVERVERERVLEAQQRANAAARELQVAAQRARKEAAAAEVALAAETRRKRGAERRARLAAKRAASKGEAAAAKEREAAQEKAARDAREEAQRAHAAMRVVASEAVDVAQACAVAAAHQCILAKRDVAAARKERKAVAKRRSKEERKAAERARELVREEEAREALARELVAQRLEMEEQAVARREEDARRAAFRREMAERERAQIEAAKKRSAEAFRRELAARERAQIEAARARDTVAFHRELARRERFQIEAAETRDVEASRRALAARERFQMEASDARDAGWGESVAMPVVNDHNSMLRALLGAPDERPRGVAFEAAPSFASGSHSRSDTRFTSGAGSPSSWGAAPPPGIGRAPRWAAGATRPPSPAQYVPWSDDAAVVAGAAARPLSPQAPRYVPWRDDDAVAEEIASNAHQTTAAASAAVEPPDELTCPITYCLMDDPVMTADGESYERRAIEEWFATGKTTSPLTNEVLPNTNLIPNRGLLRGIRAWREAHGSS